MLRNLIFSLFVLLPFLSGLIAISGSREKGESHQGIRSHFNDAIFKNPRVNAILNNFPKKFNSNGTKKNSPAQHGSKKKGSKWAHSPSKVGKRTNASKRMGTPKQENFKAPKKMPKANSIKKHRAAKKSAPHKSKQAERPRKVAPTKVTPSAGKPADSWGLDIVHQNSLKTNNKDSKSLNRFKSDSSLGDLIAGAGAATLSKASEAIVAEELVTLANTGTFYSQAYYYYYSSNYNDQWYLNVDDKVLDDMWYMYSDDFYGTGYDLDETIVPVSSTGFIYTQAFEGSTCTGQKTLADGVALNECIVTYNGNGVPYSFKYGGECDTIYMYVYKGLDCAEENYAGALLMDFFGFELDSCEEGGSHLGSRKFMCTNSPDFPPKEADYPSVITKEYFAADISRCQSGKFVAFSIQSTGTCFGQSAMASYGNDFYTQLSQSATCGGDSAVFSKFYGEKYCNSTTIQEETISLNTCHHLYGNGPSDDNWFYYFQSNITLPDIEYNDQWYVYNFDDFQLSNDQYYYYYYYSNYNYYGYFNYNYFNYNYFNYNYFNYNYFNYNYYYNYFNYYPAVYYYYYYGDSNPSEVTYYYYYYYSDSERKLVESESESTYYYYYYDPNISDDGSEEYYYYYSYGYNYFYFNYYNYYNYNIYYYGNNYYNYNIYYYVNNYNFYNYGNNYYNYNIYYYGSYYNNYYYDDVWYLNYFDDSIFNEVDDMLYSYDDWGIQVFFEVNCHVPTIAPSFAPTVASTDSATVVPSIRPTQRPSTTQPTTLKPSASPTLRPVGRSSIAIDVGQQFDGVTMYQWMSNATLHNWIVVKTVVKCLSFLSYDEVLDVTAHDLAPYYGGKIYGARRLNEPRRNLKFIDGYYDSVNVTYQIIYEVNGADGVFTASDLRNRLYGAVSSGNFTSFMNSIAEELGSSYLANATSSKIYVNINKESVTASSAKADSSTAIIIGVVVGVVGACIIGLLIFFFIRRKKESKVLIQGD